MKDQEPNMNQLSEWYQECIETLSPIHDNLKLDNLSNGIILMMGFATRSVAEIAEITKLPYKQVRNIAMMAKYSSIWLPNKQLKVEWFDEEHGDLNYALDVLAVSRIIHRYVFYRGRRVINPNLIMKGEIYYSARELRFAKGGGLIPDRITYR